MKIQVKRAAKAGRQRALNETQTQVVVEMYWEGHPVEIIAKQFGVSKALISKVLKRNTTPNIFALRVDNQAHRRLYGWLKEYSKEMGLTVNQMIWLLIQREINRTNKGRGE